MKVYELMNELAKRPAGKDVKIHLLKSLDEFELVDDDLYSIEFPVKSVSNQDDSVELDGWY
jgi:hypothetical protein